MDQQMLLFEFVESISTEGGSFIGIIKDDVDETNYLQRGEKILSLLRSKKQKEFVPLGVFDGVNKKTYMSRGVYKRYDFILSRAEKILRHNWEKACEEHDWTSFFLQIGFKDVVVSKVEDIDEAARLVKDIARKQTFEGAVKIQSGDNTWYAPTGKLKLTKKQSGGEWYFRGSSNRYRIVDVPRHFKKYYLYNTLRDRINLEVEGLTEEQLSDNRINTFLRNSISSIFDTYSDENGVIWFSKDALEMPYIKSFINVIEKHGCSVSVAERNDPRPRIHKSQLMSLWFLSSEPYTEGVEGTYTFLVALFDLLLSVYIEDKQSEKFNKNLATEYAKVYETKKAIPQKMINAMKTSSFNDYFGYVEFDAECDLDKITEIEKEFEALQMSVFRQAERKKDVSLRFRKLGHHKASGLYFPTLKCICVDVRSPSSMAHEYGHMLDYEAGNISRGVKFSKIREVYTELLENFNNNLSATDPIRKRLEGNTKYNMDYYLEPTEIFARTLEIYLVRGLEINNSLVKPDGGFAYPQDDKLMSVIKEYFDEFFYEMPAAKAVASS